jgi:hypothetical protein
VSNQYPARAGIGFTGMVGVGGTVGGGGKVAVGRAGVGTIELHEQAMTARNNIAPIRTSQNLRVVFIIFSSHFILIFIVSKNVQTNA